MHRILWTFVVCVVVGGILGCEPFDTELTLNADGSGKLTQKGTLSPAVRAMLMQGYRLAQPYRNLMQADAGQDWNAGNLDAGVKVVRFDKKIADNGAMALDLEVTFASLEKLGATVWGQSLQLTAVEADGVLKLRCQDPARFAINAIAMREMKREGASARRQVEYLAMMDMLVTGLKGLKIRTTLNLPAAAQTAEGGVLSEDKKRVTYEAVLGDTPEGLNEWLGKAPLSVSLPAGFAGLKAFEPPPPPAQPVFGGQQPAAKAPPAPTKVGEGFSMRLSYLSVNTSRSIQMEGDNREPQRSETLNLNFNLYGPQNPNILQEQYRHDRPSLHTVTTAKDDLGNDLRNADQRIWMHTYGGTFGQNVHRQPDQPIGNLQLNLKAPGKEAKAIAKLEGYAALSQVTETDTLEVKPVRENLDKEYVLGPQTICFKAIKDRSVEYVLTVQDMQPQIKWMSADGKDLETLTSSNNTDGKGKMTVTQHFKAAVPEGMYAVITYAAKVQQIKVPFTYENLKLP